jgi:hypothetical protein
MSICPPVDRIVFNDYSCTTMNKNKVYGKPRLTVRINHDLIMRVKAQALVEQKNTSQFVEGILEKLVPAVIEIRKK